MIIDRMTDLATTTPLNGVAALPHLGVIRATGDDAATFLHGQLTQDFKLLNEQQARLTAFCSAKGRMLASMVGFKHNGEVLLVCHREVLAATLKRLSMFVMRAKVKLSDASDEFQLLGLAGSALEALTPTAAPMTRTSVAAGTLIQLHPAGAVPRALWLAPVSEPALAAPTLSTELWLWGEVQSGVATLQAAVADAFVPQMLNYESVGGVNFKKGCYPGQEVVARSQYRGILKRRAFVMHCAVEVQASQEIYPATEGSQPCGQVAQAAPAPTGGWDAIVVLQLSSLEAGQFRLATPTGPALELRTLPYELLAEVI